MTGTLEYPTPTRTPADGVRRKPPKLVLGLGATGLAEQVAAHFRDLGWDVAHAATGADAGRAAYKCKPTAVVMSAELPGESGFLACAKVRLTRPAMRVVLVGPEGGRNAGWARQAGAAGYLPETAGVAAVARAVLGT